MTLLRTLTVMLALLLPLPLQAQQTAANTEHLLTLGTGASVKCKILSSTDTAVKIEYQLNPSQPAQTREVPWADILQIDFTLDDDFHQLLASTSLPQDSIKMLARWQQDHRMVSKPRHPIGDLALAFARLAVSHPDELLKKKAMEICSEIQFNDWSGPRRDHARWLRILLLDTLKLTEDATTEAEFFSKDEQAEPLLIMNAHLYLAENKHKALQLLERENPLWEDDDLVRPDREALFHSALDHYLRPSLFHGTLEDPATKGLWGAVQLLAMDQDIPAAGDRARDIVKLYPGSSLATEATNFLASNKLPLEPPEQKPEPEDGAPAQAATAPAEPEREPVITRRTRHTKPPETSPKNKP